MIPLLAPIKNHENTVHVLTHFFATSFNTVLPSTSSSVNCFLYVRLFDSNFMYLSCVVWLVHLLHSIFPTIFVKKCKLWNSSLCSFLHSTVTSSLVNRLLACYHTALLWLPDACILTSNMHGYWSPSACAAVARQCGHTERDRCSTNWLCCEHSGWR
jgi:hypothetical protein